VNQSDLLTGPDRISHCTPRLSDSECRCVAVSWLRGSVIPGRGCPAHADEVFGNDSRTKREADAFVRRKLAEYSVGLSSPESQKVTVKELVEDVLLRNKNNGNKTVADDESRWKNHLKPFFGHLRATQVSSDLIDRYINKRKSDQTRSKTAPENGTINRELALVKSAFNHGTEQTPPKDSLGIEFVSRRENIDTSGPMGRLFMTIISSIAELESDLIRERVRAGMRRARLEGRKIGRARLDVDRQQVVIDRRSGMSLTLVARKHGISRASVCRLMKEANNSCILALAVSSADSGLAAGLERNAALNGC